jgi:hypothetical protein
VEGERLIAKLEMQERLARLSTRGRQAMMKGSGSLIAAVREVVKAAKLP